MTRPVGAADELRRVYEARRQQAIPHAFVRSGSSPYCATCSLHRDARAHINQGAPMDTDRPEDIANRNYYQHEMKTRRVRIVSEVDVEWRDDDPDYCLSVARTDGAPQSSVRILHSRVVSAEFVS